MSLEPTRPCCPIKGGDAWVRLSPAPIAGKSPATIATNFVSTPIRIAGALARRPSRFTVRASRQL